MCRKIHTRYFSAVLVESLSIKPGSATQITYTFSSKAQLIIDPANHAVESITPLPYTVRKAWGAGKKIMEYVVHGVAFASETAGIIHLVFNIYGEQAVLILYEDPLVARG